MIEPFIGMLIYPKRSNECIRMNNLKLSSFIHCEIRGIDLNLKMKFYHQCTQGKHIKIILHAT